MLEQKTDVVVGIADLKVGKSPECITTNLGSCVAVCLYAPRQKVGGVLHIMMPHGDAASLGSNFRATKYANTGVPELVKQLQDQFGVLKEIDAKLFGGGKVLKTISNNIGMANEEAARKALQELGIPVLASKTGGDKGYKIRMCLESGKVACQVFGEPAEEF